MLVKIQNLRSNSHGFGDDPRLQFKAGEIKEIDHEWLARFDNASNNALFAGPVPSFRVVKTDAEAAETPSLMARLTMPTNVPKPKEDNLPSRGADSGPKTEAELLAAINDQQARAQASQGSV